MLFDVMTGFSHALFVFIACSNDFTSTKKIKKRRRKYIKKMIELLVWDKLKDLFCFL